VRDSLTNWDLKVDSTQFSLNTRVTEIHGSAPFSLFFARSFPSFRLVLPATGKEDSLVPGVDADPYTDWREVVDQMESLVFPAIRELRDKHNDRRVQRFNSTHKPVNFPPGSFVMTTDPLRSTKLEPLREGPFRVLRRNRGGSYILADQLGNILPRNYAPAQLMAVLPPVADNATSDDTTTDDITIPLTRPPPTQLAKWRS
jgi:hypothetical protein